jgi:hypothetical protein
MAPMRRSGANMVTDMQEPSTVETTEGRAEKWHSPGFR